jgi:flagellar biosynthesis/type III secretory pathway M-ring protein FliF/YscJ
LLQSQEGAADDGVNYTPDPVNRLGNARQIAQQDPRVVANVVRNWVAER